MGAGDQETGHKTLLIAGTLTSVCMAFPTLSALAEGYKVFSIIDASGNWSKMATDLTTARVVQAGPGDLSQMERISIREKNGRFYAVHPRRFSPREASTEKWTLSHYDSRGEYRRLTINGPDCLTAALERAWPIVNGEVVPSKGFESLALARLKRQNPEGITPRGLALTKHRRNRRIEFWLRG